MTQPDPLKYQMGDLRDHHDLFLSDRRQNFNLPNLNSEYHEQYTVCGAKHNTTAKHKLAEGTLHGAIDMNRITDVFH